MQHVYEPEERGVHVTAGAPAGNSRVGCADICAERDCVRANWAATAVCDGANRGYEPRGAAGVRGWLQRGDDCGADGVGVRRNLCRIRGSALGTKGGSREARATKTLCDRVGWDARRTIVGGRRVVTVCTAGWKNVPAEEHDYLPRVLLNRMGSVCARAVVTMADSRAG